MTNRELKAAELVVIQALEGRAVDEWITWEDAAEMADNVLDNLRSLPVELRMEAMGMRQIDDSCRNDGQGGHWHG